RPHSSLLFPYTTLFRSPVERDVEAFGRDRAEVVVRDPRVQRSAADLVTRMPLTLRRLRTCSSLLPRGHDLLAKALRGDVVERLQHDRVFDLDAVPVDRQSCVRDPRAVERRVCHEAEGPRIGRFGLQALVTFLDDP